MGKKKKKKVVEISDKGRSGNAPYLMDGSRDIFQEFAPSAIAFTTENEIKVENNYVRSFVINGYPARVSLGWMDSFYSYYGDMDVAVHIEPANERTALDELTDKITQYEAQLMSENERGSVKNITVLQSKIQALYDQRARLEQNYENMFHVATLCTMYDHDVKNLTKEAQKFQSKVAGRKMNIMPLTLRQDDGYKSVSPYGINYVNDYYRNLNTGALSTMFPFYDTEVTQLNGTFVGINRSRNTPIFIDFFDRKTMGNSNLFISGASGSGKTYLVSLITMRSALEGVKTVIIDPENEYGRCVDAMGGITISIAPDSNSMMNPFDIDREMIVDEDGNYLGETVDIKGKVAELLNLFGVMFPEDLTSEVKADLSDVAVEMYSDFGFTTNTESLYEDVSLFNEETGQYYHDRVLKTMPTMSDYRNRLIEYADSSEEKLYNLEGIIKSMGLYCKGGIYDLFDCYTTIDFQNFDEAPAIRFDVHAIEDDILRPIGMHIALNWSWNKFIKRDLKTKKRLVCDEAWMMLQKSMKGSDYTALFLEKCARRIRKYNGSLCCASQNFREFVERSEGQSILSNSAVRMFLKQTPDDIQAVGDRFIMSDGEKNFLLMATRGSVLMTINTESVIADVFAFPFEDELISKKYLAQK